MRQVPSNTRLRAYCDKIAASSAPYNASLLFEVKVGNQVDKKRPKGRYRGENPEPHEHELVFVLSQFRGGNPKDEM